MKKEKPKAPKPLNPEDFNKAVAVIDAFSEALASWMEDIERNGHESQKLFSIGTRDRLISVGQLHKEFQARVRELGGNGAKSLDA